MGKYLKKIKSEKQNYHKFYFSLFYFQYKILYQEILNTKDSKGAISTRNLPLPFSIYRVVCFS